MSEVVETRLKGAGVGRGRDTPSWHLHQWKCIPTESDPASKLPVLPHSIKQCQPWAQHQRSRKLCHMSLSILCLHLHQTQQKPVVSPFSSILAPSLGHFSPQQQTGTWAELAPPRAGQKQRLTWAWKTSLRSVNDLLWALLLETALWRSVHLRRSWVLQPTQPKSSNAVVLQEQEIPCKTNVSIYACSCLQILQKSKPNPKKIPPPSVTAKHQFI